jgi:propanol-preferring alcohol dehydrogenase
VVLGPFIFLRDAGGSVTLGWNRMVTTADFALSLGNSRKELHEVCQLAREGWLRIDSERFAWDQIPEAYGKLEKGPLNGRAVIVMQEKAGLGRNVYMAL